MPLQRRLPKRGFTNLFKKTFALVNVGSLDGFQTEGAVIDSSVMAAVGLIRSEHLPVKLLAKGELTKRLNVKVQAASASAVAKVAAAGGQVEILGL
jgi:large subunit ribosomal protein L15